MNENRIAVLQENRYYHLGPLNESTEEIWFVIHGYGQLARYFLRNFESVGNGTTAVVAPEATNRFYLKQNTGRVGSTWMTKEDRETDIKNYVSFLDAVFEATTSLCSNPNLKIRLLGFSQGAATVTRWAVQGKLHFDTLVLWAGILPYDMNIGLGADRLQGKELFWVYGETDAYLNDEKFQEQDAYLKQLNIQPTTISFKGGHVIDQSALSTLQTSLFVPK